MGKAREVAKVAVSPWERPCRTGALVTGKVAGEPMTRLGCPPWLRALGHASAA